VDLPKMVLLNCENKILSNWTISKAFFISFYDKWINWCPDIKGRKYLYWGLFFRLFLLAEMWKAIYIKRSGGRRECGDSVKNIIWWFDKGKEWKWQGLLMVKMAGVTFYSDITTHCTSLRPETSIQIKFLFSSTCVFLWIPINR
jgi:hypothetical protein